MARPIQKLRFRYTIRTLLLLISVLGVCSSWVGMLIRQAHVDSNALALLEPDFVDYERKDNWQGKVRKYLPEWAIDALGETFFSTVTGLEIRPSSDEELRQCLHFQDVERIQLQGLTDGVETVSAHGLHQMVALGRLRELVVIGTSLDSERLRDVTAISTLESLDIYVAPGVTSLAALARLPRLTRLDLWLDAPRDIETLRLPPSLQELSLAVDQLDGRGFSQVFSRYDELRKLRLSVFDHHVDQETIATIRRLTNLTTLIVTSSELVHEPSALSTLGKLEYLNVRDVNKHATPQDSAEFDEALPTLKETLPALKEVVGPSGARHRFP